MKIKKNLAAILTGQKKSLSIYNIEVPQIPDGYVLVKMKYSGICHTQLNEIDGILGKDNFLPHCLGHEGVGEIFKKGEKLMIQNAKDKDDPEFEEFSSRDKISMESVK